MAIVRNLASVMTTANITSSATSIPVNRTNVFGASQNPLDNPFYVTIMPASGSEPANTTNSEIALVTGISGSNLIVTRGQRSTTARAFTSGAIVTNGIYAEDAVLLGEAGTAVNPQPWIDTSDIKNWAITTGKIADGAVKSAKIDWTTFTVETGTVSQVAVNTSWVTLKTFTIANDGNYILWTKATRSENSTSGAIVAMRIQKNSTNVLQFDAPTVANYAGNHDVITQGMATFSASVGDVVKIGIVKDRANFTSKLGCQYALAQVC